MTARLADDIARCNGHSYINPHGARIHSNPCQDCLRRIAPRPEYVWLMTVPPPLSNGHCPERIEEPAS